MKIGEGKLGRVFVARLEDGDKLPDCIEHLAMEKRILTGYAVLVGGIRDGNIVVGPRQPGIEKPEPILLPVDGVHEVVGIGTIAPDEEGSPVFHIHAALGRSGQTVTGCLRPGVTTWLVGEIIIFEITGVSVARLHDEVSGFSLLNILND